MKKIFIISSFLISFNALAGISIPMQPGQWKVSLFVNDENQKTQKDQKQEMQEASVEKNICYTGYELNELENLVTKEDGQCETTVLERTVKNIRTEFVCKDGTRGTGLWELTSPKTYTAKINSTGPQGAVQKIYQAEFASAKCKKSAISSR